MATLYEMTLQAQALYELLQNEEIDNQTFNDTLEAIGADEKIESYCKIIKQLHDDIEMFTSEISRLTKRKRTADNSIKRMKNALLIFMQATGQTKAKAGTFAVAVSGTQVVNITDEKAIPAEYISLIPKIEKAKIREQLKADIKVPGAELVTNTGVRIR